MKTIDLELNEVLSLLSELEGFRVPDTGEVIFKGFINHSLPLKEKYWLNKLINNLTQEKQEIEKLRNQLIEKFGEKEESTGSISIPTIIKNKKGNEEPNPKFLQFQKEYQELLNEKKSIKYKPITLETLESITTEDTYNYLFMLVDDEENV
jgi:hypothetical protein